MELVYLWEYIQGKLTNDSILYIFYLLKNDNGNIGMVVTKLPDMSNRNEILHIGGISSEEKC